MVGGDDANGDPPGSRARRPIAPIALKRTIRRFCSHKGGGGWAADDTGDVGPDASTLTRRDADFLPVAGAR
jgi:hypothetical protein